MGVLFTNNASTTLSAAISSTSATSISVASSSTFPAPGAGEYFYATIDDGTNNEIVKVTAVSGTTWTVVRASDNTTARTFSSGDTVQLRAAAALLTDIQQNIAAKSANQTVYNATTASSATTYDVGTNPQNENNAMVFLDGVMQHHDTFSFSGSTLTFDAAPSNGLKLEVIIDNLINLQSSNLTVDTFTATNGQTAFTLSDTPAAEDNLIVFIEGVFQNQDSYSISNNVLTMSAGVTTGRKVVIYVINPVNIGTPSDGTVTSAKLSGNITTPGTLTVGSYDVAFDSPTFVVDNSNSRVGLGTASPSVPVDIVGDVKMSSTLELTSHLDMPDNAKIKLGTGDDLEVYHDGSHNYIDAVTGDQDIIFKGTDSSSDITALTLDMSDAGSAYFNNKVGIGTTSPATPLHVVGANGILVDTEGNGDGSIYFGGISGTDRSYITRSSDDLIVWNVSDGPIRFGANNGERVRITGDGKVGIGTTSPNTNLFVYDASAATHIRTNSDITQADGTVFGKLSFQGEGNEEISLRAFYDHATSAYSGLSFHYDGAAGTVEAMRIASDGKVGIGQASPSADLHITGSGDTKIILEDGSDEQYITAHSGGLNYGVVSGDSHTFVIDTTDEVVINATGMGIGTTSPAKPLEVKITSDGSLIRLNRNAVCAWDFSIGNTSTLTGVGAGALEFIPQNGNEANEFAIGKAGTTTPLIHLKNSQTYFAYKVGIQETAPDATLEVDGTVVHGNIRNDTNATRTYTNGNALNTSTIEFDTSISGSDEYNCVITWAKGTWSAFSYEFTFSAASWARKIAGGGYHNNSGGTISGHTNQDLYGGSNESDLAISGTDQTIVFTIQCPNGTHPHVHAKFMVGGSANAEASDFTVEWVAR